jgi:acyl transferase domain-containing protein
MRLSLPANLTAALPSPVKQALLEARKRLWGLWPPRHLFVFGGRNLFWAGFGRDLYAQEPVFRTTVQECERVLLTIGGKSLRANFEGPLDPLFLADEERLLLFNTVIQLALVELWRAYGVEPVAVMGVSMGENAAIYAAGGLTLADTLRVSLSGARICQVEPPAYGALHLVATYARAQELCASSPVALYIVTEVEPTRQNLFCALADIEAAKVYLRAQGAGVHQIKTDPIWPYHTSLLIQHEALLSEPLKGICPQPTTKPCYLATLGRVLPTGTVVPWEYWLRTPREPVSQYTTIQAAVADGYSVLTPIGGPPFSYLSRNAQKRTLEKVRFLSPFQVGTPELETFAAARQQLAALRLAPN